MNYETVRADEVLPGDEIFNHGSTLFPWARVVRVFQKGTWRVIQTTSWATWKHPAEGIAVVREVKREAV